MALSESGLAAQGIFPGPMVVHTQGGRRVIKAKSGGAPSGGSTAVRPGGVQKFFVKPKGRKK